MRVTELTIPEKAPESRPTALFHGDSRAFCPIQEPLEMEGRQAILRLLSDMSGKGCDGASIACFQQSEGVEITFRGRAVILPGLKRLEGTYHLASPPQHKIADRSSAEILHRVCKRGTHANPGTKLLVGDLKA